MYRDIEDAMIVVGKVRNSLTTIIAVQHVVMSIGRIADGACHETIFAIYSLPMRISVVAPQYEASFLRQCIGDREVLQHQVYPTDLSRIISFTHTLQICLHRITGGHRHAATSACQCMLEFKRQRSVLLRLVQQWFGK